jgi:V8-like Glu-specific endopeptidase
LVIDRQMKKCLAVVRTAGQKRTSSKSKLKQSKAANANYKSTKPMKSKSLAISKQVKYLTTTKLRKW